MKSENCWTMLTHTQMLENIFDDKMLILSSENSIYPRRTVRFTCTFVFK